MSHLQISGKVDVTNLHLCCDHDSEEKEKTVYQKISFRVEDMDEQEIRSCMNDMVKLQTTKDDSVAMQALIQIKDNFSNEVYKQYFINKHVHIPVLSALKNFESHQEVQSMCIELLDIFLEESDVLYKNITNQSDLYRYIIKLLEGNIDTKAQLLHGMNVLSELLKNVSLQYHIRMENETSHIYQLLIKVMTSYSDDIDLLVPTLLSLLGVLLADSSIHKAMITDHLAMMISFLEKPQDDKNLVTIVLQVFIVTAQDEEIRALLINEGVHEMIIEGLTPVKEEVEYKCACCALLDTLCEEDDVCVQLVNNDFLHNFIIPLMVNIPESVSIQCSLLRIFKKLAQLTFETEVSSETEQNVCIVIYRAMFRHIESPQIQIDGCQSISAFLENRPEAHQWIGENANEETKEIPLHSACLGSLLMYNSNIQLYVAACEAFYWLAADNERICVNLMERNAHMAVIDGLRLHLSDNMSVISACRALRGICIFHEKHKHSVIAEGALSLLTTLLTTYSDKEEVQNEIISTLACLADIDIVRYQCFIENVPSKILNCMRKFSENVILQEACLECLCVMSGAEDGTQCLNAVGTFRHAIDILNKHQNCVYIQKKGLMLLQLLAEPSICNDKSLCKGLSKILANAMKDNFHDDSILKEACVLVQIYAEMGKEMSKHFVEEGCHDLLFSIMEHHDDNTDLQDIASECLCVLSLEHDLKSNMLLSACSNGIVAGVDCLLEIGADVNFGQGQDTPLCHAVRCQNENLVKLLLKQSVIDSHLHNALMISLKLPSHQITGLLLSSIAKSSDQDVSHITWSGLQLPDVRPEWFVEDLSDQMPRNGSDTGKYITKKIKESHRRRSSTGLYYSESDSKLVSLRKRKQFRFRSDRRFLSDISDNASDFRGSKSTPDDSENLNSDTLGIPRLLLPDDGRGGLIRTRDRRSSPVGILSPITSPVGSPNSNSVFEDAFPMPEEPVKFYFSESQNSTFYEFSSKETEEWKTSTLTGANIPISPSDPRFRRKSSLSDQTISQGYDGIWMRKSSRSPSPRLSHKIEETSFIGEGLQGVHKSQVPTVVLSSDIENSQIIRPEKIRKRWHSGPAQMNPGSVNDTEDIVYSQMDLNCRRPSIESVLYQHLNSGKISSPESFFSDTDSNRSSFTSKQQLKLLDISCNIITSLSHLAESEQTMKKIFSNLVKLYLNDNLIEEIPDAIFKDLKHLELLDLKENKLTIFPLAALEHCKALISLDLSSNEISKVECEHKHDLLQELHLSNNALVTIPEHLCQYLPNLRVLSLTSNEIKVLPDKSLGLKNLKKLYLSHNKINKIPEIFLQDCKELDTLEAANNALECLPSESIATSLQLLNRVKLKNNSLTEKEPFFVPKFLLELQSLRVIDLSENGLFGLPPPSMWKTQMLKELHASKNYITKLSLDGVASWSKLETMHLSHNQIHELPKEVGALKSLTSLDVSYNSQLSTLPDELGNCSEMWELPLFGLDLDLDRSLLKGNVKDLIAFLHNKHKKAIEYYRLKMMVVGFGGRGKTTLLQALMKKYKAKNTNTATVGVIVKTWKFERFRADLRKTVTYTISTWDFAGQEEFYSTHQCYLSNRALYLVVYDIRKGPKEMELLKPWLANIHARAPGCPVIIVGTHLDAISEDKQEVTFNRIHNKLFDLSNAYSGFPEMHVAAPVDCTKENIGMEKLRNLIKDVIDNYKVRGKPVMGQMKPASYVKLSDLLAEELKNTLETYPVITHSNLLRIVQNASLDLDEMELQQAVRFLHESGVLLHYDDSTLHLRELYFIDPGWLCRMMAQVVTVPQINPFIKNGILRKNDVRLLFTGKKLEENFIFPKSLIPQYLKLLEKFEIALPYSEEELLIPSRLPEKVPEFNVPKLKKDEKICRFYRMPHVPLGLWSRLITRMIVFSKSVVTETLMELPTSSVPEMHYWKTGIFVCWSQTSFFLLSSCISDKDDKEEIQITVPATKNGCLLLGQVVDHLDALIDEWYPGLTSVDPLQGRHLLEKYAPCVYCEDSDQSPYQFLLEDLLKQTESRLDVECPQHGGVIPLSLLAPDLVLSDLDSGLQLDVSQFDLVESPENLLGDGGYGAVYKAKYKNQHVAVKMFNAIGDIHPHVMLRQEATVLRCLKHPSVVSLLAVGVRPRIIVLELALKGSLSKVLRTEEHKEDLSRIIQHRIASQVAEGLLYLHKLMIIYRDLKPDNVLIFSTVPNSMINAKISDYGIARFSTLDGLVAQEGTPAYRAPEVIRGETYSFKADVFSYGITIYSLLTGGKHPFFEYEFNSEMDRAISEATTFPTITQRGCPPWSDMQNIISRCLDQLPDKRPESKEILNQLMSPESLCLRQWVPVSVETTVECMAFQVQDKELNGGKHLNLWIGSGDSDYVQLSHFNLMDPTMEAKGAMFRYGRILCLQPVGQGFLLIGTQLSKIWVYDTLKHEFRHCTRLLPDAVITMRFISGHDTDDLIIVGLANGMIAVFPVSEILNEPNSTPMCLSPGKKHESIRCMEVRKRRLYASCGSKVVVISTRRSIFIEKTFDTCLEKPNRSSRAIYTMAVGGNRLYLSHKGSSVIQMWEVIDVKKHKNKRNEIQEKLRDSIDVAALFNLPPVSGRVTSMILQNDVLWVGTGSGSIALVDLNTKQPITITNRYTSAVRSLMYISCQEPSYKAVLSGGIGFRDNPNAHVNKEDECGCVAVWEADFAEQTKKLKDYTKSRQNLANSYM